MALHLLFLIAALILFVLAAFGVSSRLNLMAVGWACVVVALLLGGS